MNKEREIDGIKVIVSNETYNEYKGTLQDQINELQERINKALDYIKIEFCQINEETKELECWHKRVEPILDILNGKEYKEEE